MIDNSVNQRGGECCGKVIVESEIVFFIEARRTKLAQFFL
jgi:hypothetical protein